MNSDDLLKLKEKLPAHPGILRKEEYFNSAVLIPLVSINSEYNFLFEKRAANIRQGGEVCFPGGEFDPDNDSDFMDTAIRETSEEIGVESSRIKIYGILDTLIGPMGVTVDPFIGTLEINSVDDIKYDKEEVEKVFMIPVSFFEANKPEEYYVRLEVHPTEIDRNGIKIETLPVKELKLPDRYSRPWGGRKNRVLVYRTDEGVIWGITAALINEVVRFLKL